MMREKDSRRCVDVEVKRGAECHMDHQLLHAKLLMARQGFRKGKKVTSKRYAVSQLSDARTGEEVKLLFARTAVAMVKSRWSEDDPVEEKWQNVKTVLTATAESTLGYEKCRNPDWFHENADVLEPLLQKRNHMYSRWLSSGHSSDKLQFLNARRQARQAVRAAKNTWFQNNANEAQKERFGGKKVW